MARFEYDESFDRPDLNLCPDCKCYFAGDNCSICGKPCPEEMRAGNRKPKKVKKQRSSGPSYVIPWYHSWWFIVIMMFVFPLVALILAATSDNTRGVRITLIVISALFIIVPVLLPQIIGIIVTALGLWTSGGAM